MFKQVKKRHIWYIVINAILLFIICRGIYVSFFMNNVNRSLWIDEAFLASSFSKRSFLGILLGGKFEYLQSAPLGWLWFEKILVILFGNTPYVLRLGSVVGFILIIVLLTFIQIFFYKSKFPFAAAAIISNTPIVLHYSTMFKPYVTDGFVTLVIIIAYGLWKKDKIGWKLLTVIWMCLIWFSQTACFVIGGFVLCELLISCLHKDEHDVLKSFSIGSLVVLSFILYYVVWIRRMTSISGMQNYWAGTLNYWKSYFFPFPKSISDLNSGIELIKSVFKQFDQAYLIVLAFSVAGVLFSIREKDRITIGIYLGIVVALFASMIHMYPVIDRLWLFIFPALALILCMILEKTAQKRKLFEVVAALVVVIVAINNTGFEKYSKASNVYVDNEELQMEMDYLRDNMDPNDSVYVYSFSRPGFEYINGYDNNSFGGGENNVIFGDTNFDWKFEIDVDSEIERILSYSNLWIVSSHTRELDEKRFSRYAKAMHENGYLELVYNPYNTPLWHYSKSLEDVKKHFTMSVQNIITDAGFKEAVIHIKNDGEAYLNNQYDNIYLIEKNTENIFPIDGLIAPGAEMNITVRFSGVEEPEYVLRSQFGQIAKDDTIKITKDMQGDI